MKNKLESGELWASCTQKLESESSMPGQKRRARSSPSSEPSSKKQDASPEEETIIQAGSISEPDMEPNQLDLDDEVYESSGSDYESDEMDDDSGGKLHCISRLTSCALHYSCCRQESGSWENKEN